MKKVKKKELVKVNKFFQEFKTFISRGNVLELAVGVVVGGAFSKIVTSLVNDIITPLIGIIIGGRDFSSLSIKIGEANIAYGSFIQNIIDFIIIAFCIFLFVRFINKLFIAKKEESKKQEKPKESEEILLLKEIRDTIKSKKG